MYLEGSFVDKHLVARLASLDLVDAIVNPTCWASITTMNSASDMVLLRNRNDLELTRYWGNEWW